jgi:signal recognition particle GTPase
MNAESNETVCRYLHARLAETVQRLRADRTLTDAEISKCFASIACTLAIADLGAPMAAEYFRDIADEIEREACGLR